MKTYFRMVIDGEFIANESRYGENTPSSIMNDIAHAYVPSNHNGTFNTHNVSIELNAIEKAVREVEEKFEEVEGNE